MNNVNILILVITVLPASSKHAVRVLHTRVPKPITNGVAPGLHAVAGALCFVCTNFALLRVNFLFLNNVSMFSSVIRDLNATNANNFNVGTSNLTSCDPCYR